MLGISMRMARRDYPGGAFELRDALACDWPPFLDIALPSMPYILLPNIGPGICAYASAHSLGAIIFSGGDDWGVFPRRDETEKALFAWGRKLRLPMLGICRGAQIINMLMGGCLKPCKRHAARRHEIFWEDCTSGAGRATVNSFHAHCIEPGGLAPGLEPLARAEDESIEAFRARGERIMGLMWHPEREKIPSFSDIWIIQKFFEATANKGLCQ